LDTKYRGIAFEIKRHVARKWNDWRSTLLEGYGKGVRGNHRQIPQPFVEVVVQILQAAVD
jgi:hypothetical protein